MSLSALSVRRPVATAMVFLALTTLGAFSFDRLRVDLFPELDFPSISVITSYPGVGPEEMETLITRPVEEAIARVEGIEQIESFSSEGRSRVALRFDWGRELETALNDVRAAVERVQATLPDDANAPVVYKFDLTNLPVVNLALRADLDEASLRRFADDVVKPRLERVPGIASVDIRGARNRQIRVEIDAARLAGLGISTSQVTQALRNENLTVPAGLVEDGDSNVLVRAMSEFNDIDDVRNALVGVRGGEAIRVRDIATVQDDFEEFVNIVRINGVPGVEITVGKSPDANTIEVADDIYEAIESFNADYAGRAALELVVDSSIFIRRSVAGVQQSMIFGGILAIVVLLFFLRNFRSTLVIGISIPISVISTFLLMDQMGLTLNLISFGGLALGTGMLVDNAIVILENIYRRRQAGDDAFEAAIRGAREVAGAIVASTMTTVAVFAPVLFLGGFTGVFFSQMALVVTCSLAISLFSALTLIPVLSSILLRGEGQLSSPSVLLDAMDTAYSRTVGWALRYGVVVVGLALALLGAAAWQADRIGTELLPEADESELRISAEYPAGTRIEITQAAVMRIEQLVQDHVPEVRAVLSTVGTPGFWSTSGEESATMRVVLVPVEQRTRSSEEIAAALRPILIRELPGLRVFARPGGGLWIFNRIRGGDDRVRVEVMGHDLATADALAAQVATLMAEVDGVSDTRVSRRAGGRELQLFVDRDRAADYGLSTRQVAETLSLLVQGQRAGVFRENGREADITVRLSERNLQSIDRVLESPIVLPNGSAVPLGDLVDVRDGTTPQAIERLNQNRIVVVSGGNDGGRDLGSINAELNQRLRDLPVPEGFTVRTAGEGAEQQNSFAGLSLGIILALLLVYMVMAGQFESFVQPAIILVSVPFASVGVITALIATGTTLNLNSFMGVLVLVGVVVNNAIVLVDYINLLRFEQGYALTEAVVEAARRRLRPILMTTSTTVLALLPVAWGSGTGGDAQAPLARVVVGGMLSSTLITLLVVPILYTWIARAQAWIAARRKPVTTVSPELSP